MLDDAAWRCYNVTFNKLDLLLGEAQLCLPCVRLKIRKEKKRKLMTSSDPKVTYSCPMVTYSGPMMKL